MTLPRPVSAGFSSCMGRGIGLGFISLRLRVWDWG